MSLLAQDNTSAIAEPGTTDQVPNPPQALPVALSALAWSTAAIVAACGGGGGSTGTNTSGGSFVIAGAEPPLPSLQERPSAPDAARFMAQATFGVQTVEQTNALQVEGFPHWLWAQFNMPGMSYTAYLDSQRVRSSNNKATDEMSYEAFWQHWLQGADQLQARVAFAWSQIMVISNVAPHLRQGHSHLW